VIKVLCYKSEGRWFDPPQQRELILQDFIDFMRRTKWELCQSNEIPPLPKKGGCDETFGGGNGTGGGGGGTGHEMQWRIFRAPGAHKVPECRTAKSQMEPGRVAVQEINLLTPNVNCSGRTAPLTSKVAFYIFIQQI